MASRNFQVRELAAARREGRYWGFNAFAIDFEGWIWSMLRMGNQWTNWDGPRFMGQPAPAMQLAAATQNNQCMMIVMLDAAGMIWTLAETQPGQGYGTWQGPGVAGQKYSFTTLTAGAQSGSGGIQLFATDPAGQIWTLSQTSPGGPWGAWQGPGFHEQPFHAGEVAATAQNDGNLLLVAEAAGTVSVISQLAPDGGWGDWRPLAAPAPLTSICAVYLGGTAGTQLWGIDQSDGGGEVWTCWQASPGGPWSAWQGPGFNDQPQGFETIVAGQNGTGQIRLVARGIDGTLTSAAQGLPGVGDWGAWDWMPPITGPV